MRNFSRKFLAAILSAAVLISSMLCMPLTAFAEDDTAAAVSSVALSDSFEDSADAWTNATLVTDNARTGENALQLGNTDGAIAYRTFEVEANTDYFVNLWTKNGGKIGKYWGIKPYSEDEEGVVDTDLSADTVVRNDLATDTTWFGAQKIFNSGDNTTLTLIFEGAVDAVFYVDDIEIRKAVQDKENNLIKNGSFENGLVEWTERYHSPALLNRAVADGIDGDSSAQTSNNYGYLSQRFEVKPNTNYVLKYSYKRAEGTNWEAMATVTPKLIDQNNGWDNSGYIYQKNVSLSSVSEDWATQTVSFNSGENSALTFGFRSLSSTNPSMYIDDVQVYETSLVINGGLEYGKLGWGAQYNGIDTIENAKISTTEFHSGTTSATASGYSYVSTVFDAEANTDYIISFWLKSTGTMQFRLSDGPTANKGWNSVTAVEGMGEKVIGAKADWTRQVYFFNSGDIATGKIGVIFRDASNSGRFYVDDVEVSENSGIVKNGGLEYGKSYWGAQYNGIDTIENAKISTTEFHSGTTSATASGYSYVSTVFDAEANTDYIISFWLKSTGTMQFRLSDGPTANKGWNSVTAVEGMGENVINAKADWTKVSYQFNSGAITTGKIGVIFRDASNSGRFYVDDVEVVKNPYSGKLILNGDLEAGNCGYSANVNWGARYNGAGTMAADKIVTDAHSGDYAVATDAGYVATYFTPEADTYYTVSFYAKGAWSEVFALSGTYANKAVPASSEALGYMTYGNHTDWRKYEITFWSGDAEKISLAFKSSSSTLVYIDDIVAEKSTFEQIPAGDLDIDGTIGSAKDIASLRKLLIGAITEVDIAGKANLNGDSAIDILDLVRMKKIAADK